MESNHRHELISPFMGNLKAFIILCILIASTFARAEAPEFLSDIHRTTLQDPGFNKTYSKSGCFIRAHWIADLIQKSGHEALKVFIETVSPTEKMQIQLPSGRTASWVFHVAAGFKDSAGQIWVVDPILASEVVTIRQWLSLIESQNPGLRLVHRLTGPEIYHVDPIENADFLILGTTFSKNTMDFIRDAMEQLFIWETY